MNMNNPKGSPVSRLRTFQWLLLLLLTSVQPVDAAPASRGKCVPLVKDGNALAEIVVPEQAGPAELYAARELADYLRRISGATVPIRTEAQAAKGSRILVGRTRAAAPVLAELAQADSDSFAVRRTGRDILLVGASERATLYAAYDLLERDLGCRWLAPGEAWEDFPEQSDLCPAPANRIERPGMKYRFERMTCLPGSGARERDCLVWAVRQRINVGYEWSTTAAAGESLAPYGGFRGFMWPHSLPQLTDTDRLHREHPAWFALVNGKRGLTEPRLANLCTSDPEVIEFMANLLAQCFRAQPQLEFLPLGPGDGTAFCQCDRCRALDTGGHWELQGARHPLLSDRWMTFVNAVADKLAVMSPGKRIYSLAYHQTFAPPIKARPRPNVMIMVVNSRPEGVCFVHPVETAGCANNALFRQNFKAWAAMTPAGMMAYQYMPHSTFCLMPLPAPHKFVADIRWLAQSGCAGYEGQSGIKMFGLFGVTLYTVAKAMWNPRVSADAVLREYCDVAFHEASQPMQAFFEAFHQGQAQAEHTSTGIWTALPPAVLKQAREHMDQAQARARDPKVKRRLTALDAHLRFAEQSRRVYDLSEEAARRRDAQLLDQAVKLANQSEAQFNAAAKADPECVDLAIPPKPLSRCLAAARQAVAAPAGKAAP